MQNYPDENFALQTTMKIFVFVFVISKIYINIKVTVKVSYFKRAN